MESITLRLNKPARDVRVGFRMAAILQLLQPCPATLPPLLLSFCRSLTSSLNGIGEGIQRAGGISHALRQLLRVKVTSPSQLVALLSRHIQQLGRLN